MRLVGLVAVVATGCSLATVHGPAEPLGATRPICTQASLAPRLDIGVGTAAGLASIAGGVTLAQSEATMSYALIGAGIASLLVFYGAATIGVVRMRRCRDAVAEWNFRAPSGAEIDTPE